MIRHKVESHQEFGDDSKLECPTCGKCFHSKPNLRQHLRIHSGRRYECQLCHETFSLQSNMIRHQRTCHVEGGPFKCSQCTHCYATTKGFKRHFAQAHGKFTKIKSQNVVPLKKFNTVKRENRKTTTVKKQSNNNNKYAGMSITYQRPSTLSTQKLVYRQPSKIKFNFKKPSLQTKKGKPSLSVSRNSTTITVVKKKPLTKLMTKLIALVTGDDSYSITTTETQDFGIATLSTRSLVPAAAEKSPVTSSFYSSSSAPVCEVCSKRFLNHHTLRSHMSVHTGERPWDCDLCGQKFRLKGDIVSHKKTNHVKDGNYKCSICPCRFISMQGLKRHTMVIHQKRAQQFAPKTTTFKKIPNRVVKVEPVVKPDQQHNKVTLKFANTKKTRSTVPRKFSCDLCSASFNYHQNLNRHRKNSHVSNGQYKCPHCTCSFVSPTSLRTHEAIFHQLEKKSWRNFLKKSPKSLPINNPQKKRKIPVNKETNVISQKLSRSPKVVSTGNHKLFLCQLCGASFKSNANCSNHISVSHVEGGNYSCRQCPCIFSAFKGLKRHEGIYHNSNSKNLKVQGLSSVNKSRVKLEHHTDYIDDDDEVREGELKQFEIYNDYEEDEDYDDDRGRQLEIYNDFDEDDGDEGQLEIYEDDDGDWEDMEDEEEEEERTNPRIKLPPGYLGKPKSHVGQLPQKHKQIIFEKDLGDEEECLDIRHLATVENDPLDFDQEDDDDMEVSEYNGGDYTNFRNDSLRMVKLEAHHEDEGDPLEASSINESTEEFQQQQLTKRNMKISNKALITTYPTNGNF